MREGRILLAHSGRYRVEVGGEVRLCVPRGTLRRRQGGILTGDLVRLEGDVIAGVLPRRNSLERPPVANIDRAFLVVSLARPEVSRQEIDRRLVVLEARSVPAAVVVNKVDLVDRDLWQGVLAVYRRAGYPSYGTCAGTGEGMEALGKAIGAGVSVLLGPSGVGKSTLLSHLTGRQLATREVGRTERGRHTTKWVELLPHGGGYVVDTPGFGALDLPRMEIRRLASLFPEIAALSGACRFADCAHDAEPDCAVKAAVDGGMCDGERYRSYVELLREVREAW